MIRATISMLQQGAIIALLSLSALIYSGMAYSAIEEHQFATPQQEQLYQSLIKELRCLVCQNQNLADSNADLAKDLRNKTYAMVTAGKNHKEIAQFMTDRYGDFVMYRPPVKANTALLWFGPFFLLAVAGFIALRRIRKNSGQTNSDNVEGLQQAKDLLNEK